MDAFGVYQVSASPLGDPLKMALALLRLSPSLSRVLSGKRVLRERGAYATAAPRDDMTAVVIGACLDDECVYMDEKCTRILMHTCLRDVTSL